jgi:surfeit locus 1 family protein
MRISGLTLATGVALLILIGLGTWQLQRRAEKLAYIEHVEAGMKALPQPFPSESLWPSTDFSKLEHSRVDIEGHFLALPEVHLYALLPKIGRHYGGVGWWVIMPFEMKDGGIVLVNRGFVPQDLKNPSLRSKNLAPPGEQKLEGFVRLPEKPGRFTPASSPSANEWYLRNPAAFAEYDSLDKTKVAPVVIDQLTPNADDLPQTSDGKLNISNNHLEYAITWYALALVLLVIYILLRRRGKTARTTS